MPEVFQYAVLQVVPSIERGERLNVGVVVHARRLRFLEVAIRLDEARLRALAPDLDLDALREHLDGLARVAAGDPTAGAVAALERSERFHWLVAPSSTIVQAGPVHTGLCEDADAVVARLLRELVG
ncbi:DUF3037 domain-containing protein [Conexibacter sp. W3-3-2]|uniref:DUF3037 domain-containing protein n=1 Tax=Paraconexibacter algicola TaxID=2133960 RepID=A0A2T4UED6_9ACTN|nr:MULTISPECIES: DUF3037 domain-containing protein [Solirubrobacterales]MTD42939.1 DUF3037 domain-containing protein [Conexibacter sp. W3-3-2]PTL56147.1 DUF3037 domain-containing protein [Paraconexibacter algicola]